MSTVAKTEFEKSLARLEGLTKSQLFHTPSNSDPQTWAGSKLYDDEDEHNDGISENGTDYDGVKKALAAKVAIPAKLTKAEVAIIKGQNPYPHIKAKLAKGKGLTAAERWVAKGLGLKIFSQFAKSEGMDTSPKKDGAGEENKTAREVPQLNVADKKDGKIIDDVDPATKAMHHDDGDDDDDDHEMEEAHKSLAGAVRRQPDLSKGIEMSPILHQFAVAMGQALEGQEKRVIKSIITALTPIFSRVEAVEKSIAGFAAGQDEFNKSIGEAVVGIGSQIAGAGEVANANNSLPAGPPRSQLRSISGGQNGAPGVSAIAKSFGGPGGLEDGDGAMAKSQIVNVMTDMVKGGKLNPLEVVKYESTGELTPAVQQAVLTFAQGGGR